MRGHIYNEIERKAKRCVIEEGKTADQCIDILEEEYELSDDDKEEIRRIIKDIGE